MTLCLGRLVITSLRNYLQIHLMFLSNDSLQDPLLTGTYQLVIISVTAAHVRLVIFPRHLRTYHSARNYHGSKQENKKHKVFKQNDIQTEGSNKKTKQTISLSMKIYKF